MTPSRETQEHLGQLWTRVLQGDVAATHHFLAALTPVLAREFSSLDYNDVCDLVGDTTHRLYRRHEPPKNVLAWCLKVAKHMFVGRFRDRQRRPVAQLSFDHADTTTDPATQVARMDLQKLLRQIVQSVYDELPLQHRQMLHPSVHPEHHADAFCVSHNVIRNRRKTFGLRFQTVAKPYLHLLDHVDRAMFTEFLAALVASTPPSWLEP